MDLFLSNDDIKQLENIGEKYPYAQLLWNIAIPSSTPGRFTVGDADAWEWKDAVDNAKGFLPLTRGELRKKLTDFYERIG